MRVCIGFTCLCSTAREGRPAGSPTVDVLANVQTKDRGGLAGVEEEQRVQKNLPEPEQREAQEQSEGKNNE